MKYYCAADGGFYSLAFHGFIPEGAVEVADEDYAALIQGQEQGKRIVAGNDGYPMLADPLPASPEVLAAIERQWRDERLLVTDGVVSRHRDEVEGGAATTLTPEQYTVLQVYRHLLRDWPQGAEFPLADHRPIAPPWLADQLQ